MGEFFDDMENREIWTHRVLGRCEPSRRNTYVAPPLGRVCYATVCDRFALEGLKYCADHLFMQPPKQPLYVDNLIEQFLRERGDSWRGSTNFGRAVASAKSQFTCQGMGGRERRDAARKYVNDRIQSSGLHLCKYCNEAIPLTILACKYHEVFESGPSWARNTPDVNIIVKVKLQEESAVSKDEDLNYCVIAAHAGPSAQGISRTWKKTEKEALDHAQNLARDYYQNHGKPVELYVVEVKKIITCGIPDVEVRNPKKVRGR